MKTINELEQEAISNAIMQLSCVAKEMTLHMQTLSRNLIEVSEQMRQLQAVSMCISSNEVSGDGSGQALPEVSQEERDSDGWSDWNGYGHDCPIPENLKIEARFANGDINNGEAGQYRWHNVGNGYDLIAYRIVKGE